MVPNIAELIKKNKYDYLLEINVDYPEEMHDKHNELPFIQEKMKMKKVEKLIPNLKNKKQYVIHIRAKDQAMKHRLVLKKVHKVIQFKQSAGLKSYIDLNTRLKTAATNEFERDFF